MSRTNDVTLFSNGIGHFRRTYNVPHGKEQSFSIPFKRDHIGDVATSLQVFGKVKLSKPPSFTPSNANATALNIDQDEALKSLLTSLSGSQVTVKFTNSTEKSYTLLGLDSDTSVVDGQEVRRDYVALMSEGAVKRKPLNEIEDVHFDDEGVRTEIDKALKNNFQRIKPDSTLLDLSLTASGDSDQEAVVQYTIPVAAWKMRYAFRQDGETFTLEGAAVIDNNTDEDWDNFRVSVVTGNPISFNTDIANVVMPSRKFVRLVDSQTLGNVDVGEAYDSELESTGGGFERHARARGAQNFALASCSSRGMGPKGSVSNYAQFGMQPESMMQEASGDANLDAFYNEVAESAGVDSKEVGDFCVFTSKEPITILARKSAVVPMFTVTLTKAGVVLLYKESNHARRPFRAVKFKNESDFFLGKGKTIIYNSGLFSGECVLEPTKPGENRMLPHCLENSVAVNKETKPVQTRRQALKISDGVGITEDVYTAVTTYVVENKKEDKYKMALEHSNVLKGHANLNVDFDGVEVKEKEKLASNDGYRAYFELAPKQKVTLTVTETSVSSQKQQIGGYYQWLVANVIDTKNPLAKDKGVMACIDIQKEIDGLNLKLNEAAGRKKELAEQVQRVRENLSATKDVSNSSTINKWVADLDATEGEIRTLDKTTMPDLRKQIQKAQERLNDALTKITANWKAEANKA